MSQISLPFDWHGGAGAGDFLVSDANRLAVAHLERWRDWPLSVSVLTGPPLSGRSTLAGHFAQMSGGEIIDDAQGGDEHRLFHAWNDAQTSRRPLLMIGRTAPAGWTVALPDLRSRLAAAPHIAIEEPDEGLARALICRAFDLAGANYAPDVPDWLLRRVEHRYGAIAEVTRLLDVAALSSGRKISVAMAKETLQSAGFLPIVPPDPSTDQRE
ncbi:chromosomal replication initiator DnaA [Sphingobium sp.]|uniref:chromosomal replication initiator DnaA n=1 Tax=Sphingobium sp. TaxID=1912891 RepID=UPI0026326BFD|nr:chromosomal replication initiator DnaA [Sphingobium sp.]